MSTSSIKIKLYSYDSTIVDALTKRICERASNTGTKVGGPFPLPMEVKRFTVNRSPHIFKKSREHYEMRIFRRLMILHHSSPQTIDALMNMQLPDGVDVSLRVCNSNEDIDWGN